MPHQPEPRFLTRRAALVSVGRLAAATALGAGVLRLVARDPGECRFTIPCANCGLLRTCELPPAREARHA